MKLSDAQRSARGAAVNEGSNRYADQHEQFDMFLSQEEKDRMKERELFPTQPWNVRAMIQTLGPLIFGSWPTVPADIVIYEPCAGLGHQVAPLREYFPDVRPSDIEDWRRGFPLADALAFEAVTPSEKSVMCTNPPFTLADAIVRQAQKTCDNVIILARLGLICGKERYELHHRNPLGNLKTFLPCTERTPMVLGFYDPAANKPQEFAWFHYQRGYTGHATVVNLPPGLKAELMRPEDVKI
ncbi:methyltransferase small [Asticcacaulis biprosthecium C19]|uniref:Methyltransferase small n=1 Tax=Asticcacaulis biprosthecium C19 TaxID=715226 RepID=F4QJ06_9CAUL|nr:hypothetical protein [Asticcacaulis biprosthecium]EGF93069.1 methyltransferase small [Asticcacaulis biprosthecium C19]